MGHGTVLGKGEEEADEGAGCGPGIEFEMAANFFDAPTDIDEALARLHGGRGEAAAIVLDEDGEGMVAGLDA